MTSPGRVEAQAAPSEVLPPFLPVRMLNEFTYCARLGYLEWAQGEFTDNHDTVEGRYHHRNVDRTRLRSRRNEDGDGKIQKIHERSVWLGSEALGLSAKIDLLEGEERRVMPIDYKRGKRPHVPRGAYEPELVQLCAQGLLLRDHGYECDEGVLFFLLDDLKGDIASQPDSHERPTGWAPQHLHSAESAFPGRVATNDDGRSAVAMQLTLVRGPRSTASLVEGSTRPAEPTTFVRGE